MATTYFYTVIFPATTDETITTESNLDDVIEWNLKDASVAFAIAILICASNLTIMLAFLTEKRLRVYSNYYVINMAIADLLVGLLAVGPAVVQILYGYRWPFGYVSCAILIAISHAALHVSIIMVLVISVDRWYAVYYPLKHISIRSRRSALRRNILVWAFCFTLWIPVGGVWGIADPMNRLSNRCSPLYTRHFATSSAAVVVLYWLPVSATAVFYFLIYRKVRASKFQNIAKDDKKNRKTSSEDNVLEEVPVLKSLTTPKPLPIDKPPYFMNRTHYKTNSKSRTRSQSLPALEFNFSMSSSSSYSSSDTLTTTLEDTDLKLALSVDPKAPPTGTSQTEPVDVTMATTNPETSAQKAIMTNKNVALIDTGTRVKGRRTAHDVSKMQRTLSLLLLALVITWTPYACFVFAVTYCRIVLHATRCFPAFFSVLALLISWCNSLLNPFMYAAAQPLFRKTVSRLLFCKKKIR